ncbi:conserved hypothetical protein [Alteromonas macleodii]|uniref:Uncharacterized protein n=1 Tax=Alteromonas macleodii TaxID=28108 RepID=A0AB36FVM7_ALTMA|nr:hypothetical protein BFV95_0563 [Alteromonas macleodii]OES35622.1 hypothetical protein BFV94_0565 [Alteromonas macleodii]OES36468.1 hypothetical protein BFV93_0563 [Alteromonas macleodii]OES42847.1 hypothetical protein BFV96_0566 [Alteromonas macleodii]
MAVNRLLFIERYTSHQSSDLCAIKARRAKNQGVEYEQWFKG